MSTYVAAKGAKLYMLCRSQQRAEAAKKEIQEKTNNENIEIILADLSEMAQVRDVVKDFQSKEDKLDCLVCNAGVLLNERRESKEGIEVTFASHFLGGSYLLSKLLLPQLRAAKEQSRVVFVTSGGMLLEKFPVWETATSVKKEEYNGQQAYSFAKRGQVRLNDSI